MFGTLGNIGDFVGGVGVLITLIYLAVQVHQAKNLAQANAWDARGDWGRELMARFADSEFILPAWLRLVRSYPPHSQLIQDAQAWEVEPEDLYRATVWCNAVLRSHEQQFKAAILDEESRVALDEGIRRLMTPDFVRTRWDHAKPAYAASFARHVDGVLRQSPMAGRAGEPG